MKFNLNSVNPEQRRAVTSTEGPVLVLAGAGSGKTRVITSRIAHLIRNKGVPPSAILAVTFTNKAAREMAGRVRKAVRCDGEQPLICTFHAFGVRLLHTHIGLLGYRPNFLIMDSGDQQGVIKTLMEEGDYDTELYLPAQAHFAPQQAKSRGITPEMLLGSQGAPDQLMLGGLMAEYQ